MSSLNKGIALIRILRAALLLSFLSIGAVAEPTFAQSPPTSGSTVAPIKVEVVKSQIHDVRRRSVISFGELREGCPLWRFEMSSEANGRVVFQVNEPVERQVVLRDKEDDNSYQILLGDAACRFQVKIERIR
jgi:hypothetical protein